VTNLLILGLGTVITSSAAIQQSKKGTRAISLLSLSTTPQVRNRLTSSASAACRCRSRPDIAGLHRW
jgi:hypothetical protein